jgi:hypothetical protein
MKLTPTPLETLTVANDFLDSLTEAQRIVLVELVARSATMSKSATSSPYFTAQDAANYLH